MTVSGEQLAHRGFSFPPDADLSLMFIDGWEVRFERVLVTIGSIELLETPDRVPTDQSQTGPVVARRTGPWVVDLHRGGNLPGQGGGTRERAQPITAFSAQNLRGNIPFLTDTRYALSWSTVLPTETARRVNVDAAAEADYQDMTRHGWTMLFVGEAWFRGGDNCRTTDPTYDFSRIPQHVRFRLGYSTQARWNNCQNERLAPASGVADEQFPRGVQVSANRSTIAQLTFHIDHAFAQSFRHHAAMHFDPLAAQKLLPAATEGDADTSGANPSVPLVTERELLGVPIDRITDGEKRPLPWRWCTTDYVPPGGTYRNFDTLGIAIDPTKPASAALADLHDYVKYLVSWQGHLNGHGLCFTQRLYPSP